MKLFGLNGCIGEGAHGPSDFPSARDLLNHMDYLGIDRSLAWHVEARDLGPVRGNLRLLEEIANDQECGKRLFPSFVITPSIFYEHGAMEELRKALSSGTVRSLRVFPGTSRFAMRTIERVLREVNRFKPLVLWDFKDSAGISDCSSFGELARKFPDTGFILTELMWGHFNSAVDLMWREENINIDISWLHMRDAVEFLCEEFGAERVLFGGGFKSHYGAALAGLRHAGITERERNLIACGNIERMLGAATLSGKISKNSEILSSKPLWKSFSEGNPVEGAEIIDTHGHTGPHTRGWLLRDIAIEDELDNMVSEMDACGVSRTILAPDGALFGEPLSGHLEIESKVRPHPGRFLGYLCFNPWYEKRLLLSLDDFFSRDFFIGFKILPSYWKIPVGDKRYLKMFEYADRKRLPVLLHTWEDKYDSPSALAEIAPAFPGARFILGHSGGGTRGRMEAAALALANENVFLEFCGSFTTPVSWVDTIGRVGIGKIIFGSDSGAHSLAWELGRFLSIPVPDNELKPALGDNFKRIIELKS